MSTIASSDHPHGDVSAIVTSNQTRLRLYFAILSCLGGLVLASGQGAEMIPVIAIFFAVFGFVFVDWLKLFALPPIAAYILMGIAAVYCVSDFWRFETPGNQQMLSVAQLLVYVQAILMLQTKNARIFEQLGVFCLLELVVAAVFNDAVMYGLLLVPIGVIGAWALAMLAAAAASEGLESSAPPLESGTSPERPRPAATRWRDTWIGLQLTSRSRRATGICLASSSSVGSLALSSASMRRFAILTMTPAICLVGGVFFYAIPRTTDAARMEGRGNVLVGFDDQIRLEQIGHMLQSSEPAVRVRLSDRRTGRPYMVVGGLYLRGQVLEDYRATSRGTKMTATWSSVFVNSSPSRNPLPREFHPTKETDANFYDSVTVEVNCEAMGSPSLFSIAPYFRTKDDQEIVHADDRWTIARRERAFNVFPRIRYLFGTNAFRGGVQADMIAAPDRSIQTRLRLFQNSRTTGDRGNSDRQFATYTGTYANELMRFDGRSMPTIQQLANDIRGSIPPARRTVMEVAKAFERHLAFAGGYDYTLSLTADSVPGLDPIEQFISVDRRGSCQYFSSAMVMMLRSVGIPARVVVGYRTDEYSEIGQYYLARQNHAHAWVEALIQRDQISSDRLVYGQPPADQFWVRLDPTPGGGGGANRSAGGGVAQVFDLVNDMWEEYVVEMDARRQNQALTGGGDPMTSSYGSFVGWIQRKVTAIRAGGLGGGSLALRDVFSWRGAFAAAILAAILFVLLKLRLPGWFRRRITKGRNLTVQEPGIRFYAQALDELSRLGFQRQRMQTPREFSESVADTLAHGDTPGIIEPLSVLTAEFCRQRYGSEGESGVNVDHTLATLSEQVEAALSASKLDLSSLA